MFGEDKTCFIIPPHWLAQGECILGIRSKSATLTKTLHEIVLSVCPKMLKSGRGASLSK